MKAHTCLPKLQKIVFMYFLQTMNIATVNELGDFSFTIKVGFFSNHKDQNIE